MKIRAGSGCCVAFWILACVGSAFGQSPGWTRLQPFGPEGGSILSITAHPTEPYWIFAGSANGTFSSYDGGQRWRKVNAPSGKLAFGSRQVGLFWAGPHPGRSGFLYKSTD